MSRGRIHGSSNENNNIVYDRGQPCMVVIDPATCMLRIPLIYIHKTRAQNRSGSPSLCQLFLNNRCRQGSNCFQVHADLSVVMSLRNEVDSLPYCCMAHGDADRLGIYRPDSHETPCSPSNGAEDKQMGDTSGESSGETHPSLSPQYAMKDVVLYIPGCTMGPCYPQGYDSDDKGPYIPISRCSYTLALRRLLTDRDLQNAPLFWTGKNGDKMNLVLDASNVILCRMHIIDRCLYAEECKFLHLCKEIALLNPDLIHSMGLQMEQRQLTRSPRHACSMLYQYHPSMASPSFHAGETCCCPMNPRMWQSPGDHSYSSFLTDSTSRYKEQPPAIPPYMWNPNIGPCNIEGHPQDSGPDPTTPSCIPLSKPINTRRLLIPGGMCSEPNSDDTSTLPRIPSLQSAAQHPCQHIHGASQPHSIDSCPDTNAASSFSTLMNDKAVMSISDPAHGTNLSTSNSSKLSNQNANKNESYTSLINSSRTVTSDSPKPPLPNDQHTLLKHTKYLSKSCPAHNRINFLAMDPAESTTIAGADVVRRFNFRVYSKDQNLTFFEKSTTQQKSTPCWQHNPYSGVTLGGINLFCNDNTVMSANV
ncbi:unnamed protein product [Phytomonas sp. EM1]|nr:unnamed protein product [Phytomonas sp. EM1]|eukprot:CCW65566.1 unnamed protein product [Phytomonas sp. isolate EM1]